MAQPIESEKFERLLQVMMEETFDDVKGIFLDQGTSLFETIDSLDAETVSRPIVPGGTNIAAQVGHTTFYLNVMEDFMQDKKLDKIDWGASWKLDPVTTEEWNTLKQNLRDAHDRVMALVRSFDDWNTGRRMEGALALIIHTTYHIGSIRQILRVVKETD